MALIIRAGTASLIPLMIAIGIAAGGQDAQGSERGREYDAVSGAYAEWIEHEVPPLVEKNSGARLTKEPDYRATMVISSSGAEAFTMAWFHPELYHRVPAYSATCSGGLGGTSPCPKLKLCARPLIASSTNRVSASSDSPPTPTAVNQQWPHDPSLRGGAWEYHSNWAGRPDPF